jgi:hypothetical protein
LAAEDEDSFICDEMTGVFASFDICTEQQCDFYIKCFQIPEEDVPDALPECVD